MILGRAICTPEDEALRDQIIRFCENEIAPHGEAWKEAGGFPRELYKKAGDAGVLGLGFSEECGSLGGMFSIIVWFVKKFAKQDLLEFV